MAAPLPLPAIAPISAPTPAPPPIIPMSRFSRGSSGRVDGVREPDCQRRACRDRNRFYARFRGGCAVLRGPGFGGRHFRRGLLGWLLGSWLIAALAARQQSCHRPNRQDDQFRFRFHGLLPFRLNEQRSHDKSVGNTGGWKVRVKTVLRTRALCSFPFTCSIGL